jgi:calcium-dependent protein kinase
VGALTYLNNRNICHRDIKPENILYNKEEKKIKLIDFGISKKTFLRGYRRDMLTIIGTHLYMAPEVYLGGGYDEKIDLWALGATIYKLITGKTPFESEYHSDTINNILRGEPEFDEEVWGRFHFLAKDFVGRLLKKKEQRMTLKEA